MPFSAASLEGTGEAVMDLPRSMYPPHMAHPRAISRTGLSPWRSLLSMLCAWKAALRAEEAYEDARARGRPRDVAAMAAFIALSHEDLVSRD